MKVIPNCPPKEESEYCEKAKSSDSKETSSRGPALQVVRTIQAVQRSPYTDRLTTPLKKNTYLGTIVLRTLANKIPSTNAF